jgi:hypothetical protein
MWFRTVLIRIRRAEYGPVQRTWDGRAAHPCHVNLPQIEWQTKMSVDIRPATWSKAEQVAGVSCLIWHGTGQLRSRSPSAAIWATALVS